MNDIYGLVSTTARTAFATSSSVDDREDAARQIGPSRRDIVFGGVDQRLDGDPESFVLSQARSPPLLQRVLRRLRARTRRLVVLFLPAAARRVVVEEPSLVPRLVESTEERDDDEALHGQREVRADHLGEPVRLPLERQPIAGELLVVLELELEEADRLHGLPGRSRDRDRGEVVRREDLPHLGVGDGVPGGGAAIARHHDPVREPKAQDGRPLRHLQGADLRRRRQRLGALPPEQLCEARVSAEGRPGERELDPVGHSPPFWT